jgi:hypothetical protein
LIEADPDIGYKDDQWILKLFEKHCLGTVEVVEMPANNLALVLQKNPTG